MGKRELPVSLLKRAKEGEERDRKISEGFAKLVTKSHHENLLTYWEKQLILFTKGHYKTTEIVYLRILVAEAYALPLESLHMHSVFHMMTELHSKLVAAKILRFDLLDFVYNSAKRSELHGAITIESFIWELFAQFQGISVKTDRYELDLGEVDVKLFNLIKESKRKDINNTY